MSEENIKLPFKCEVFEEPETIANPYTGEKVLLQPKAVAVYDMIKGAEMLAGDNPDSKLWDTVRKGLDWFRKYYPKEYMVLLD